jgi:predicted ferric reductase
VTAIFAHPILITISYGEQWLYSVIPQVGTVAERHMLLGQIALWLLVIVWVTSALARGRLSFRTWKYIHWLAYICVPFALLHVPDLGSQEATSVAVKAYLFVLGLTFAIFSLLRLQSLLNLDRARYRVTRHIQLTDEDFMIELAPLGRQITPHRGQYVYVKLGFLSEDHPFSVTQFDPASGRITLTYRLARMFTRELHLQSQELKFVLRTPPAMSLGESHAGVLVLVALVVDIRAHVEVDERRDDADGRRPDQPLRTVVVQNRVHDLLFSRIWSE